MASTATPYGMIPIGHAGSAPYSGGTVRQYRITQDNTYAMAAYGWCTMNAGKIDGTTTNVPAAISGTAAPSATTTPLGIIIGFQYTDATLKYTLNTQYLAASAITGVGHSNILVSVITDPFQLYMIQADGVVTQAEIGMNMNLNANTLSTTTNRSIMSGVAVTANTATFPLRVVDLVNQNSIFGGGLSAPGDAFTDCIVQWNFNTLSIQNSTGV
jgi:hypothetical protein